MRKLLIAATALIPSLLLVPSPAPAAPMPWCAVINMGTGSDYWDCRYPNVESCVPAILSGSRGFCVQNPAFMGAARPAKKPRR